eukprot:4644436-Pyramimonas_sp.AAC.1
MGVGSSPAPGVTGAASEYSPSLSEGVPRASTCLSACFSRRCALEPSREGGRSPRSPDAGCSP